jgi:hypothetical protein
LRFLLIILPVAAAALAGGERKPLPRAAHATTEARPEDREIEEAIRARFAKSKIAPNRFSVRVQGGVATLEGRTEVIQHKGVATRLARLAGARQVINRIEVSQAAREKASANLAKGRRRVQVRRGEPRSETRAR